MSPARPPGPGCGSVPVGLGGVRRGQDAEGTLDHVAERVRHEGVGPLLVEGELDPAALARREVHGLRVVADRALDHRERVSSLPRVSTSAPRVSCVVPRHVRGRATALPRPAGRVTGVRLIRLVLADDHAVVRAGLKMLLDADEDLEVVAEAGEIETAKRKVVAHKPDVIVLDLNMPGGPSLPAIPELAARCSVVVLTMQNDPAFAREAFQSGARGYVLKEAADAELVEAVRAAAEGRTYLNPSMGARMAAAALEPAGAAYGEPQSTRRRSMSGVTDPPARTEERLTTRVRDLMRPGVITIAENAALMHAKRAMVRHGVHAVLVVGADTGHPLGWVLDHGLLRWLEQDLSSIAARQ